MTPVDDPHNTPGASVRSAMAGVARFRADLSSGSFYKLLLGAYSVLAIQVLGFANLNLVVAAGIVEAAPVGDPLFTVPALTLLPGVQFAAISILLMYLTGKGEIPTDVRKRASRFVKIVLLALLLALIPAAATLPLGLLAVLVGFCLVFYLQIPMACLQRATGAAIGKLLGRRPVGEQSAMSEVGYVLPLALSAKAVTDLWGLPPDASKPRQPADFVGQTEHAGARTRIGAWLTSAGLVVAIVAFYPRPWMPTRVFLTREVFPAESCGIMPVGDKDKNGEVPAQPNRIVGYPIGETAGRLTVLALNRDCLVTLDTSKVSRSYICKSPDTPIWAMTGLDYLRDSPLKNKECPQPNEPL